MPKTASKSSRLADKFVARLVEGQRERIAKLAQEQKRAMNDIFVYALDQYLDGQERQKLLLDALENELASQRLTSAAIFLRYEELEAMQALPPKAQA